MDNFVSRAEMTPVDRAVVRAPSAVAMTPPVSASRTKDSLAQDSLAQDRRNGDRQPEADPVAPEMASIAEYVEMHARIAEILADLRAGASDLPTAALAVNAMIPNPIVVVPLPPASKEALDHAAATARRMIERAVFANAAQGNLPRPTVEQIASSNI